MNWWEMLIQFGVSMITGAIAYTWGHYDGAKYASKKFQDVVNKFEKNL